MAAARRVLFFVFIILLLLPFACPSTIPSGLDAFFSSHNDPHASNDTLLLLPSRLRKALSSLSSPISVSSLLSILSLSVPVSVKLVGSSFSSSSPSHLHSFVSASVSSLASPFLSISSPHFFALSHQLHLSASLSSSSLSSSLSSALSSHLSSSPTPFHRSALSPVPVSLVDSIISRDFHSEIAASAAPAFYIYLIYLGKQSKPYAYTYDEQDSSTLFTKCYGTLWAGKDRYLWIDLGAGPVDYGPALSGEGVLPRGELNQLAAAFHGRPKGEKAVAAELAGVVLGAYKALIVPSFRVPVFFDTRLLVRFIHVHGMDPKDNYGLDWSFIEKTVRESNLMHKAQDLEFKLSSIPYSDCSLCSFAIAKSLSSYTSRFLFENYTLIVSEYVDSKQLHEILLNKMEEFHKLAAIQVDEEYWRIVPVYIFDLDYDKQMLLDRYHPVVAFRDMVIAIRTKNSQIVSDYSCNGRHVISQTRNLNRPIVAAVLQSMWGVSPTHLSWSPEHNSTLVDYTWSVGQTPFGPFSEISSLSFAQKDAARRNALVTTLNYSVSSMIDILDTLTAHGGEKMLSRKQRHVEFIQRWNMLLYKLEKAVSAMSHLDYDKAVYFLRSSDHDLYGIHTLVYQASQELEAALVCFKDPPFPWASVSMSGVFMLGFFYIYARRDKIFRSKRKQF